MSRWIKSALYTRGENIALFQTTDLPLMGIDEQHMIFYRSRLQKAEKWVFYGC
jgi:hypothetical protein